MPGSRTRHDGSHQPPMLWDEDEAATRAYQRDDEHLFPPDASEATRRGRVVPLLRAPQRVVAAPVPSLRAHIEAQRAAAAQSFAAHRPQFDPRHLVAPPPAGLVRADGAVRVAGVARVARPAEWTSPAESIADDEVPPGESFIRQPTARVVTRTVPLPQAPSMPVAPGLVHVEVHSPVQHSTFPGMYAAPARGPEPRPEPPYRAPPPPISAPPPQRAAAPPQYWQRPVRFTLPSDEMASPFARRSRRRSSTSRTWIVLLGLCAAFGAWYARDSLGAPRPATAIVPVRPLDAIVSIDGQELAPQGGLFKIPDLASDRDHVIEIGLKGYVSQTRRVRLNAGEVRVLPGIELEAMPSTGGAPAKAAAAELAGAEPSATKGGGQGMQASPRATDKRAALERQRPPAQRSAARSVKAVASASDARARRDDDEPPAPSGPDGVLRINSLPWAEVMVDGKTVGTTPQQNIVLAPGRHKVKLVNPELGMTKGFTLHIEPGQTVTKSVTLVE